MYGDPGSRALMAAYDSVLAANNLPRRDLFAPESIIAKYWKQATEIVARQNATESQRYSQIIWSSPLAPDALLIVEAVERQENDADWPIRISDLLERYRERRRALFAKLLADTGQDVCRECRRLWPAREVQLVCVYECYVKGATGHRTGVESQYFGYLCLACRTPIPMSVTTITCEDGSKKPFGTFRVTCEAAVAGGSYWVLLGDESDHRTIGDYGTQPDLSRTKPVADENLATSLGLPPDLSLSGTLGTRRVVIQLATYAVPLEPATATV